MIRADEVRRVAARDGIRPAEVEKEYLQYAFLHSLAADPDGLRFRGGSMLRLAHGHPRYSEDLDFVRHHTLEEAEACVDAALHDVPHWGLRASAAPVATSGRGTQTWLVDFRGPLWKSTRQANRIRIQVGPGADAALPASAQIIRPPWADIPAHTFPCQDRVETCAEKVRGLVERDVARDLYDLAYLVDQGHRAPPELVAAKLAWTHGDAPRRIQPHARADYDRDLADWVPPRARLPWTDAWVRVRPWLRTLPSLRLPAALP